MNACDNTSVGALIHDDAGRLLLLDRARQPYGWAPPAGHVDRHGGKRRAMCAEVREEVGLTVLDAVEVWTGWWGNRCRRSAGTAGAPGHLWTVYGATVTGTPHVTAEAKTLRWVDPDGIQALAQQTIRGGCGLEPVWVLILASMGRVHVDSLGRAAMHRMACGGS